MNADDIRCREIMKDLGKQARRLLEEQKRSWGLLRQNYDELSRAQVRRFDFGGFLIKAQCNPGRLASVCASVDEQTIRNRPCFLCDANRPPEQHAMDCGGGFKLLCNPFPILPEHFTIIHTDHRPQRVLEALDAMLELAHGMSGRFTIFYNGPQCGASAPDHLHLQAGTNGFMPIDSEYARIRRRIGTIGPVELFVGENYLRRFVSFESADASALKRAFASFHTHYHRFQPATLEPLMNVMCAHVSGTWRLIVIPRSRHRPDCYLLPEPQRLLLSPGSVDMGGVVIVPRQADFNRLTRADLSAMYQQTGISAALFSQIISLPT